MGTYDGLAVPLSGGFVCQTLDSTVIDWLTVTDYGACKFLNYQIGANNYGVDVRSHMTDSGDGLGGQTLKAYMYHDSGGIGSGQAYAAFFMFQGAASMAVGGGRIAVLDLYMNLDASYNAGATTSAVATSFINFDEGAKAIPALFTIVGVTEDDGFFVTATNAVIDHALLINVNNVVYYIGLYDATS